MKKNGFFASLRKNEEGPAEKNKIAPEENERKKAEAERTHKPSPKYWLFDRSLIVKEIKNVSGETDYFMRDVSGHKWVRDAALAAAYFQNGYDGLTEEISYDEAQETIKSFWKQRCLTKEETAAYPPSAPVAAYYEAHGLPYSNKDQALIINYAGTNSFWFDNIFDFYPPRERFHDLMSEKNLELEDAIWLLCLFSRHGMVPQDDFGFDYQVTDEAVFRFTVNGVQCIGMYDLRFKLVEFFAVPLDAVDQREAVAETIRDVILAEGRSVTCDEWKALCAKRMRDGNDEPRRRRRKSSRKQNSSAV